MARVPTSTRLAAPGLSGGRAVRNIPAVEVPGNFQVPVADLPDRINAPQVDIPTPDLPNSVPVATSVNVATPEVPKTLYTASDRAALAGPGRALAELGGTVYAEANRWGAHLQALEMGKAKTAMVKGLTQLDSEIDEDPDYTTHVERYAQGAAKVKADAMRHLTTTQGAEEFANDFDVDVAKSTARIQKQARARDEQAGRDELTLLLKTKRQELADPLIRPERREALIEEADRAVDGFVARGYITEADGETRKAAFKSDVAEDQKANEIYDASQSGDPEAFNRVREDLDGGKGLHNLRRAGEEVQKSVVAAADTSSVSAAWLAEMAQVRSGFDPANLYAIPDHEWAPALRIAMKRNATLRDGFKDAGVDLAKLTPEQILELRSKPQIQAMVFAESVVSHIGALEEKLGGAQVGLQDVFLAQVIGDSKAATLIQAVEANPNAPVEALFPADAKANLERFQGKTVGEVYTEITSMVSEGTPSFAYRNLDAATRLSLKNQADQEEHKTRTRLDAEDKTEKARVESLMKDDTASIEATGVGVQSLVSTEVSRLLGPERAAEHAQRREVALAKYEGKQGLESLTDDEIMARVENLAPVDGSEGYAAQQDVYDAVAKRAKEIIDLRESDPALAVEKTPEVQLALAEIDAAAASGVDGVGVGAPEQIGRVARARMAAEERLDIPEGWRSPITRKEAKQLMRRLAGLDNAATKAVWTDVVNEVEVTYGKDLAKQVIASAIAYEIGDQDQAKLVTSLLNKAAKSGRFTAADIDPFYQLDELRWSDGFMNLSPDFAARKDIAPGLTMLNPQKRRPRPGALDYLRDNPDSIDQFMSFYGWSREEAMKELQKAR